MKFVKQRKKIEELEKLITDQPSSGDTQQIDEAKKETTTKIKVEKFHIHTHHSQGLLIVKQ